MTVITESIAKNFSSKEKEGAWRYYQTKAKEYPQWLSDDPELKTGSGDADTDDDLSDQYSFDQQIRYFEDLKHAISDPLFLQL